MSGQVKVKTNGKKNKTFAEHWQMLLMALPGIGLMFLFNYLPMFGTVIAFKRYKVKQGIFGSAWMNPLFRNFEILFRKNSQAIVAIRNTLFLNFLFITVGTLFAVFLALMFNEINNRAYKRITQSLSFLPYFISTVVVGIFASSLLGYESGTINALISARSTFTRAPACGRPSC